MNTQLPSLWLLESFEQHVSKPDPVSRDDQQALLDACSSRERVARNKIWLREGDRLDELIIVVEGILARQRLGDTGQRQILSMHHNGELVNYEVCLTSRIDCNLQALTPVELITIPRERFLQLVRSRSSIRHALRASALAERATTRDWLMNLRRRSAESRVAFLLCEFAWHSTGGAVATRGGSFDQPLSQQQIADAAGLTSIHVNRVFAALERDGHLVRSGQRATIPDWEATSRMAGFDAFHYGSKLRQSARFLRSPQLREV